MAWTYTTFENMTLPNCGRVLYELCYAINEREQMCGRGDWTDTGSPWATAMDTAATMGWTWDGRGEPYTEWLCADGIYRSFPTWEQFTSDTVDPASSETQFNGQWSRILGTNLALIDTALTTLAAPTAHEWVLDLPDNYAGRKYYLDTQFASGFLGASMPAAPLGDYCFADQPAESKGPRRMFEWAQTALATMTNIAYVFGRGTPVVGYNIYNRPETWTRTRHYIGAGTVYLGAPPIPVGTSYEPHWNDCTDAAEQSFSETNTSTQNLVLNPYSYEDRHQISARLSASALPTPYRSLLYDGMLQEQEPRADSWATDWVSGTFSSGQIYWHHACLGSYGSLYTLPNGVGSMTPIHPALTTSSDSGFAALSAIPTTIDRYSINTTYRFSVDDYFNQNVTATFVNYVRFGYLPLASVGGRLVNTISSVVDEYASWDHVITDLSTALTYG